MFNIVYTTTHTKPGPEIALGNALADLKPVVGLRNIIGAAYLQQVPRGPDGFGLVFKLTEEGMALYLGGTVGPLDGWHTWPKGEGEPDWSQYPVESLPGGRD